MGLTPAQCDLIDYLWGASCVVLTVVLFKEGRRRLLSGQKRMNFRTPIILFTLIYSSLLLVFSVYQLFYP